MKKVTTLFLTAFTLFALLSSCTKDNDNDQIENGTGTLKGKIRIDWDATDNVKENNPDDFDGIPTSATVNVYAVIDTRDLIIGADSTQTYELQYIKATSFDPASGEYVITIPANTKPVTVSIFADDIRIDKVTEDVDGIVKTPTVYKLEGGKDAAQVRRDQVTIADLEYAE